MRNVLFRSIVLSALLAVSPISFAVQPAEEDCSPSPRANRRPSYVQDCMDRKSDAKQLALEVANMKVGDRGLIVRLGAFTDNPTSAVDERYLSMDAGPAAQDQLLYCFINQPTELEVVAVVNSDLVVKVDLLRGSRCNYVLMPKKLFVKHKNAYLARESALEKTEAERKAELERLQSAQKVWSRPR